MHKALTYKTKQFFFVLIKISIVFGAFYFIYHKITSNTKLQFFSFIDYLSENEVFTLKNTILLLILSVFNWVIEILKWKNLVSVLQKITFLEALKQTLASLTASLLTPNRIGDYGAKALFYKLVYSKQIVLINFVGNLLQMLITTLFGLIGLCCFICKFEIKISQFSILIILFLVLIVLFFVIALKQNKVKIKGFSLGKTMRYVKQIPNKIVVSTFVLSFFRYVIFSCQFYFLLSMFGVTLTIENAIIGISTMYLLASILPSIFIFDVLIKGSVAVFVFSFMGINEFTILSVVLGMWILNFVLPSVVGSYYVLTFKFPKKEKLK